MNMIWQRADGFLDITTLTPAALVDALEHGALGDNKDPTEQEIMGATFKFEEAKMRKMGDIPDTHKLVATAVPLPSDPSFIDAWTWDGTSIVTDMQKAKEIHREQLRRSRKPLWAALDIEYQRADEKQDAEAKAAIAAKKQALRDITEHPSIEAATTVEQLKVAAVDLLK